MVTIGGLLGKDMKALKLYGPGDFRCEDVPVPDLAADEVLLRVIAAGICGSDVPQVYKKGDYQYPIIPGHEFVGEVVSTGADIDKALIGKRATAFPILPCFACEACKEENYTACVDYDYYGLRRNGAFAEYIAVKAWNLIMIPDDVKNSWAVMAEPCAVAIHALGKAYVRKGDTVCIFGAGAIGLIIAQLARGEGADVVLLDTDEKKLAFARNQGFDHALNPKEEGYIETILKLTMGRGADVCIDAAGAPASVAGCLRAAGVFATIVLLGNPSGEMLLKQHDYKQILRKQLTLAGTCDSDFGERENNWKTAIFYMESGILDLAGFITHVFPLEEGKAAFGLMRDRNEFSVKVLFVPGDDGVSGDMPDDEADIEIKDYQL